MFQKLLWLFTLFITDWCHTRCFTLHLVWLEFLVRCSCLALLSTQSRCHGEDCHSKIHLFAREWWCSPSLYPNLWPPLLSDGLLTRTWPHNILPPTLLQSMTFTIRHPAWQVWSLLIICLPYSTPATGCRTSPTLYLMLSRTCSGLIKQLSHLDLFGGRGSTRHHRISYVYIDCVISDSICILFTLMITLFAESSISLNINWLWRAEFEDRVGNREEQQWLIEVWLDLKSLS